MKRSPSLDVNYMDLLVLILTRFRKVAVFPHQAGSVLDILSGHTTYTKDYKMFL